MADLEVPMGDVLTGLFMTLFAYGFDITQVALLYFIWRELRAIRIGR
jgi:hypothetical protein